MKAALKGATFVSMTLYQIEFYGPSTRAIIMNTNDNVSRPIEPSRFNYDLARMSSAVASGTISLPRGLTHAERKEWIRKQLAQLNT